MQQNHRPSALAAVRLGLALALLVVCLSACQSSRPGAALNSDRGPREESPTQALNDQLARAAFSARSQTDEADYRVGPGDVVEIFVFQVEELSRTVRVRPDGTISLPLLGSIEAAGYTTSAFEQRLAEQLGAKYLWDPQVSVFVKEFRAHPVSVLGEVNEPGVFYLQEPRTLVEVLSDAGGLTEEAGSTIHLRRKLRNPETGRLEFELLTLDLHAHLESGGSGPDLALQADDTVYVPKAGVVFVEGAVRKPDVYPLQGSVTVLKAITMAGGLSFKARMSGVQLIRAGEGEPEVVRLDLAEITRSPANDVLLRDGDIVVVGSNPIKVGLDGIWRGFSGLVRVSAGL